VEPGLHSYHEALQACAKELNVEAALGILERMKSTGTKVSK